MQTGLVLAWLYTIAEKRLVDELRRRARTKAHLRQIPRSRVAVVDDPYGAVLADAIRRAIERLPSSQRRVVVMKVFNRARALQPPPNRELLTPDVADDTPEVKVTTAPEPR